MSEALKYLVQAKNLLDNLWSEENLEKIRELLDKAEEALVNTKGG